MKPHLSKPLKKSIGNICVAAVPTLITASYYSLLLVRENESYWIDVFGRELSFAEGISILFSSLALGVPAYIIIASLAILFSIIKK